MIVFFDHHAGVGGGQVVLVELCKQLDSVAPVVVAAPTALADALWTGGGAGPMIVNLSQPWNDLGSELQSAVGSIHSTDHWVLLANTYPAILGVLRTARHLRHLGVPVTTGAIMHSYPGSRIRRWVIRGLLARVDHRIPVEPGLGALAPNVEQMPILVLAGPQLDAPGTRSRTRMVKSYARSDPSKGLHLLEAAFRHSERGGKVTCRVAVSRGLESRDRYTLRTTRALGPWLEDGRRSADWIHYGDIFVLPSIYGEAVSLTVQEAMSRGAFVVAPRLGAIPFLASAGGGVLIYPPGDPAQMAACISQAANMPEEDFLKRCTQNQTDISRRVGDWSREFGFLIESWATGVA